MAYMKIANDDQGSFSIVHNEFWSTTVFEKVISLLFRKFGRWPQRTINGLFRVIF